MSGDETGTDEGSADGATADEPTTDGASTAEGRTGNEESEAGGSLTPVVKSSLLWGVVGALSFLVLIQGYELVTDQRISFLVKFGVALLVGAVAGGSTYAVQGRIPAENESA